MKLDMEAINRAKREFREHRNSDTDEPPASIPVVVSMNDVQPEAVEWLWYGYVPVGKITVFDGDPGNGKSTITIDITARITIGAPMPDGSPGIEGNVVIVSAEDGLSDTIRPRLDAAGAVLRKVKAITAIQGSEREYPVTLPDHLPQIETAIKEANAKLCVLDPLMAFLSPGVNSHKDAEVRRVMYAMKQVAERTGAAVLIVRHLTKAEGGSPIYRGGGSIGIIGAARSGLVVGKDPDNDELRVLASTKSNLSAPPASLSYRLESGHNGVVRVTWMGNSSHTAASILAIPNDPEERNALTDATETLRSILADGPLDAKDAHKAAREAGISNRSILFKAKVAAGIIAKKVGPKWVWEMNRTKAPDTGTLAETEEEYQAENPEITEGSGKSTKSTKSTTFVDDSEQQVRLTDDDRNFLRWVERNGHK